MSDRKNLEDQARRHLGALHKAETKATRERIRQEAETEKHIAAIGPDNIQNYRFSDNPETLEIVKQLQFKAKL